MSWTFSCCVAAVHCQLYFGSLLFLIITSARCSSPRSSKYWITAEVICAFVQFMLLSLQGLLEAGLLALACSSHG